MSIIRKPGEWSSEKSPNCAAQGNALYGLYCDPASDTACQNLASDSRAPSRPPRVQPWASTAAFIAPALVALMPSKLSRPSSIRRSSTPHAKARWAPPPCRARLTGLTIWSAAVRGLRVLTYMSMGLSRVGGRLACDRGLHLSRCRVHPPSSGIAAAVIAAVLDPLRFVHPATSARRDQAPELDEPRLHAPLVDRPHAQQHLLSRRQRLQRGVVELVEHPGPLGLHRTGDRR